jgi:plastocyanin
MTTFDAGNVAAAGGDVYTLEAKIWGGDCLNLASEIKSFPLTHSSGLDGSSVDFGIVPAFDIVLDRVRDDTFAVTIFGDLNGEVIKKCREVQLVDPKAAVTTWEEPGNDISATESWTLIPSADGGSASFIAMSRPTASFVTITISDEGGGIFSPASITVPAGTTVTWVNKTTIAHTITGSVPGFANSGMLDPNQLFSQTFDEPGTYSYACDPHKWMTGTVVVTGS